MKLRIYWVEYHNPESWGDTVREGIRNILASLPYKAWHFDRNERDGWIEVECEDTFMAENIKQAKKIASEYDCGCDVFTVFNEAGKRVFTEEDI